MQWQLPVPDLTTLSHSSPGEHCIQPALHAVWNGTSNTSWYQRQASQEAGLALSRQGLGRQHTYQSLHQHRLQGGSWPTTARFF